MFRDTKEECKVCKSKDSEVLFLRDRVKFLEEMLNSEKLLELEYRRQLNRVLPTKLNKAVPEIDPLPTNELRDQDIIPYPMD